MTWVDQMEMLERAIRRKCLPFSEGDFSEERSWIKANHDLKKLYVTSSLSRI